MWIIQGGHADPTWSWLFVACLYSNMSYRGQNLVRLLTIDLQPLTVQVVIVHSYNNKDEKQRKCQKQGRFKVRKQKKHFYQLYVSKICATSRDLFLFLILQGSSTIRKPILVRWGRWG